MTARETKLEAALDANAALPSRPSGRERQNDADASWRRLVSRARPLRRDEVPATGRVFVAWAGFER
jgi:hypothetical protein